MLLSCLTADSSTTCAEGQHSEESMTRKPLAIESREQHSKRFINIKFYQNELHFFKDIFP